MRFRSLFHSLNSTQGARQPAGSIQRTIDCQLVGHPEFQIRVSDHAIPAQDISWLLRYFEQQVADGERFQAGETIQIGWMLTRLEATADGFLRLTEPDMKAVPIKFIDSVDNTLKHLRNQKDVVESIGATLEPDFPSLQQSAVVDVEYKSASRLLLTRDLGHGADSGWSLTVPREEVGSQFLRISLYQLGVDRPDLIKFFALSPGLQVHLDNLQICVTGPAGEIQPAPGSYLERLKKHRIQRFAE
ncbi:hypothetical protein BCO18442_02113 [Burkholderia contaminans]|nr:hypothetical protein BCO18442_02113 [Burkholderia contaminans]